MQSVCNSQNVRLWIINGVHWKLKMQQTSSALGVTTQHCIPFLFFSPPLLIYLFILYLDTFPSFLMLNLWLFPSVNFRWYSIGQAPSGVRTMPDRVGINVGSLSLQQPQCLLFFHALGMFCQPLNAASLAAFVETACAQRWFTCKLIAAPCVKKAWPVLSQPVRAPPARYISIVWWGTGQRQAVSLLPLFFFFFSFKEREESLGKEK